LAKLKKEHSEAKKLIDERVVIKNLKAKLVRTEKQLNEITNQLKEERKKNEEEIVESLGTGARTLFLNEFAACDRSATSARYDDGVKAIATTLHFYSPQAYGYLRKHLTLPCADSIRCWAASIQVQPGFLTSSLNHLKQQMKNNQDMMDVAIVFDSMSIKKEVSYDPKSKTYKGFVEKGGAAESELASEALVLMVLGLKKVFKQPIAYYLVNKITANHQAQILKEATSILTGLGFNVHAYICDGAYVNQSTAAIMGCSLASADFTLPHPSEPQSNINFIIDPCHLLKNVRNCFGDQKVLYHQEKKIEWKFIEELHKNQLKSNLYLSKITGKHLDYAKSKMNVKLAAQTISTKTADAIDHLREDQGLEEFAGSQETSAFIRNFNNIFDFCNSSNVWDKGTKSAITISNIVQKEEFVNEMCSYINELKDENGKPIITTRRKTGFLGFMGTMHSILNRTA
jgi:hypothetical protein